MKCIIAAFLYCLLATAFANASLSSFADLAKIPVIRFGEPVPKNGHILMFPAGQPITIYKG